MFQGATNKWLELFPSPPFPKHISSHVLLQRRETQGLWWCRRHSTFWAGKLQCHRSEGPVSTKGFQLQGWECVAKNRRKFEVIYKLRPNHHTDVTTELPLWSSDSIKITRLHLERKSVGLERLTKYMQYWKQRLVKEVKKILALRRFTYELSSNLIIACEGVSCG